MSCFFLWHVLIQFPSLLRMDGLRDIYNSALLATCCHCCWIASWFLVSIAECLISFHYQAIIKPIIGKLLEQQIDDRLSCPLNSLIPC